MRQKSPPSLPARACSCTPSTAPPHRWGARLFLATAERGDRDARTHLITLAYAGCRLSDALAFTADRVDPAAGILVFESIKKRRDGICRAVPLPPALLETLDGPRHARDARQARQRKQHASLRLHVDVDEVFYMPDGEVEFLLGDRRAVAGRGALAFIPRGTGHGSQVGDAGARLPNLCTPAGFEQSVTTLGGEVAARTMLPVG